MNSDNYETLFDDEEEFEEDDVIDVDGDDYDDDGLREQRCFDGDDGNDDVDDYFDFDEDEEELKEQLDMHSMILTKNLYNDCDLDEPLITAEQVLNEIDSMMTQQVIKLLFWLNAQIKDKYHC